MIAWHYVRDEPIPRDGRRAWLAVHDRTSGKNHVVAGCLTWSAADVIHDNSDLYYAWTDWDSFHECDLVPPPAYREEGKWDSTSMPC